MRIARRHVAVGIAARDLEWLEVVRRALNGRNFGANRPMTNLNL